MIDANQNILLIDIDKDIKSFLQNKIDLKVKEGNTNINVPILYADSEKWNIIKKNKPIYDKKNKLILPILLFRRNSDITINDQYPKLNLLQHNPDNMLLLNTNKYDKNITYTKKRIFNLNTERKTLQFLRLPTYITVNYSIFIYTRYIEQANELIEQFIPINNTAYGNKYHHRIKTTSINSESQIELDNDRLIRTDITLEVNSIILSKTYDNKPNVIKRPNITKLSVNFIEKEI